MSEIPPPTKSVSRSSGSALLVTLLVVSLLLVMVLSLVVVVRMELRKAVAHQELMQARANARLGAELAIARLQVAAGPDQRITLSAWVEEDLLPEEVDAVPFYNRQFSTIRDAAEFIQDEGALAINPRFQERLTWLTSGIADFDPLTDITLDLNAAGVPVPRENFALMVGPGSSNEEFVAARTEPVTAPGGSTAGEFAFWVSDENMKAKLNMTDPYRDTDENPWSLSNAQRFGPEWIVPGLDPENPDHRDFTARVHSDPQWGILAQALNPELDENVYKNFFHSVTSHSLGLPVNMKRGGLKRDLTAIIEAAIDAGDTGISLSLPEYQELIAFNTLRQQRRLEESLLLQSQNMHNEVLNRALPLRETQLSGNITHNNWQNVGQWLDMHKIYPPSTYSANRSDTVGDPGGPQWRQLLQYMAYAEHRGSGSGENFVVDAERHRGGSQYGVSAVPIRIHYRFRFSLDTQGSNYIVRFHILPAVAMWNPYNTRIRMPELYMSSLFGLNQLAGVPLYFRVRHPTYHNQTSELGGYWMPPHQFRPRLPFNTLSRDIQGQDPTSSQYAILLRFPERIYEPGETVWFELGEHHRLRFMDRGSSTGHSGRRAWHSSGYSLIPWDTGVLQSRESDQQGGAYLEDPRAEASYFPMVEGLSNDGGYSLYLEENLTYRTKTEAGGWIAPFSSNHNNMPEPTEPVHDYTKNLHFRAEYQENAPNTRQTHDLWPVYPMPSFQYREYGSPNVVRTHEFNIAGVNGMGQEYASVNSDDYAQPAINNYAAQMMHRWSSSGGTHGTNSNQFPINPWFIRKRQPDTQERWRNKKVFPLTYNEHGIIYESPARPGGGYSQQDFTPADSVAVDRSGINTSWDILEVRLGMAGSLPGDVTRGYSLASDIRDPGRGIIAFHTTPPHAGPVYGNQARPFIVISGIEPELPTAFFGDPLGGRDNAFPINNEPPIFLGTTTNLNPSNISMPSGPFTTGDHDNALSLSFGWMFAMRMPDHGIEGGDPQMMVDIPWLSHYNPVTTWTGPDPLSVRPLRRGGIGNTPTWIGGMAQDQELLDPLNYASGPNNREVNIGHQGRNTINSRAVLLEIPRNYEDLGSLGQLMHAQLHSYGMSQSRTGDNYDRGYMDMFHHNDTTFLAADINPVYAIGGSAANPLIPSTQTFRSLYTENLAHHNQGFPSLHSSAWNGRFTPGLTERQYGSFRQIPTYDQSFFLNHALWDDYMLTGQANSRLQWEADEIDRDFHLSANRLLVDGAFNINSTSVAAWAALLGSFYGLEVTDLPSDVVDVFDDDDQIPFTRQTLPKGPAFSPSQGDDYLSESFYRGYRRLSPDEIWDPDNNTGLAVSIVEAIRERGPFYSLADFINRDPSSPVAEHRKKGALQQAIDRSGINHAVAFSSLDGTTVVSEDNWDMTHMRSDGTTPYLMGRYIENIDNTLSNLGAPGTIIQQDILAKIGGFIQPRSDTFKIRAYGSYGQGDTPGARAWCEIIVQRFGEYLVHDPADPLANGPGDLPEDLSPINQLFGRRFRVIGFRWLSEDEI